MIIIIAMDEEKLIEAVCTYPCIWHVSSKSYKDIIAKQLHRGYIVHSKLNIDP